MGNSIFKNLSYNVLLQVVLMILPLVSIPFVSRILGPEGIGAYSYTLSLTQYFIIIGSLGLALYGNRQIAYTRDHPETMAKTFWSILGLRILTTTIALIAYYLIFWNTQDLYALRMVQSIHIVASMFDITWLFVGLEDFKRIVTRNLFIKLIGLALIFMLIHTQEDVLLYTLINLGMSVSSSLIMWLYVPKLVKKVKVQWSDVQEHVKPALHLFIPQIASQVYVLLDKTMIGLLSSIEQVGFYTQAERIVKAVLELITALGTVMLPRMSNIFAKGDHDQMKAYLNTSLKAVTYVSLPMFIGIVGVAPEFVPWFFGPGYDQVVLIMQMLASILLFVSLSSVLGVQFLIPSNRVNEFTFSIVLGAIVNIMLNSLLIPRFGAVGAVIGTFSAEASVMFSQFVILRSTIDFKSYFLSLSRYGISVLLMFFSVRGIALFGQATAQTTIFQALSGALVYLISLSILKEEMNLKALGIVRNLLNRIVSHH